MIDPTVEAYEQLLKQFYRKAIRTHPNRHDLITKFIKISIGMKEQRPQESPVINSPKSRPNININEIKTGSRNKIGSSRDVQPQSAKLSKKYSDDKSEHSGDSDLSRRKNRDQQKYFNCEWIYKANSFKKVLSFALIFMIFQNNDFYNFTKLKDNLETYFEENSGSIDSEMKIGINEWGKLDQTFQKKDRVRWTKILPEIFVNITNSFTNVIFQCLTRVRTQQIRNPTKQTIDSISKNSKVNITYFQIFHSQILKMMQKSNSYKIDLTIGYIKQDDLYVFSNKIPQKSESEEKKEKVIKNIAESIANLLKEYDANTQRLMSLDILSDNSSKEANIKSYLLKKDTFK